MTECYICYEYQAFLQCPYCDSPKVCLECIRNDSTANSRKPICFECSKEYDISTLVKQGVPLDWIRSFYITQVSDLLFKEEQAMLPSYMEKAAIVNSSKKFQTVYNHLTKRTNYIKIELAKLRKNKAYISGTIEDYMEVAPDQPMISQKEIFNIGLIEYYHSELNKLTGMLYNLEKPKVSVLEIEKLVKDDKKKKKTNERSIRCASDNCKGYIDKHNKCSLCNNLTCPKCLELRKSEHKCNPDTLKSVEAIANDSRPCPNCEVPIHRPFGCSQMFCINCKTFFNYETGQIYSHAIENPEYNDFIRRGGEIQIGSCCNRNNLIILNTHRMDILNNLGLRQTYRTCSELVECVADIQYVIDNLGKTREAVSIMYLSDLIDEDKWKHYLVSLNIRGFYEVQKRNLIETFRSILVFIFNNILNDEMEDYSILDKGIYETFEEVRNTFNRDMAYLTEIFKYGEIISIDRHWILEDTHIWTFKYAELKQYYEKMNAKDLRRELHYKGIFFKKLYKEHIVIISMLIHDGKLNPLVLDANFVNKNANRMSSLLYHLLAHYPNLEGTSMIYNNRIFRRQVLFMIKNPVHMEEIMAR